MIHENSTSKISERFINHLEEQISFLGEQLRKQRKDCKLINKSTLKKQWVNTDTNYWSTRNLFLKTAEENTAPVKQKLSHNTETTNNTDLNTSVIKTSKVDFTIEKSNEIETDLSNNTDKINSKSENKQEIRKNNDIKIQKSVIILGDSMVKHIHGWEITWNSVQVLEQNVWKTIWNLHYKKILIILGVHPLSKYAKFSEKLTFLIPFLTYVCVLGG